MKKGIVALAFTLMFSGNCMRPQLCIEENEVGFLREYHAEVISRETEDNERWEGRYFRMPKTEDELNTVYDGYSTFEYKDVFFSPIVANIEGELSARCKDGNLALIDKYLGCMNSSFNLFLNFRDQDFSNAFFKQFRDDMFGLALEMENEFRENELGNGFTRESTHFVHVVAEVSSMLSRCPCLADREPLFRAYSRLCLHEEYTQSDEFKEKYNFVLGMLSGGVPLDGE